MSQDETSVGVARPSPTLVDDVANWRSNHFSRSMPLGQAAQLLRALADDLVQLEDRYEVLAIVGSIKFDEVEELVVTVFLTSVPYEQTDGDE